MHAVRLRAFGPAENLTYERTADPVPAPGQVRIAVAQRVCTSSTRPRPSP